MQTDQQPAETTAQPHSEIWKCSPMLRWKKQDPFHAMLGGIPVLQQLWSELATGKQEWRDVPAEQ